MNNITSTKQLKKSLSKNAKENGKSPHTTI